MNHKVSVVIPTHRQRFLEGCLEGLAEQSNTAFEVVVVENGAAVPGTRELVHRYQPRLQIRYHHDPRAGLNRARNAGAALAGAEVIALLDDDCRPVPGWVDALVDAHAQHADAGTIGGRVCLDFVEPPPGWLVGPFRQFLGAVDWSPGARPLGRGEWLVGANLSFRKSVWLAAGGFRQDLGMVGRSPPQLGNDEFEFIQRAAALRGSRPWYSPEVAVLHLIDASRTTIEWFEWRGYGQGYSDIVSLRLKEPEVGDHRLYFTLDDCAERFVSEQARRLSVSDNGERALEFRDNLLRCRLAQLHGMFDAIVSSGQRFRACASAPDAYRRGVSVVQGQLSTHRAAVRQLFEQVRQELHNRADKQGDDSSPGAWLSELAGMRDEIVTWMAGSGTGEPATRWSPPS